MTALDYEQGFFFPNTFALPKNRTKPKVYCGSPSVGLAEWWAPVHSNNDEEDHPHEISF
jgi:hypothetical protein